MMNKDNVLAPEEGFSQVGWKKQVVQKEREKWTYFPRVTLERTLNES